MCRKQSLKRKSKINSCVQEKIERHARTSKFAHWFVFHWNDRKRKRRRKYYDYDSTDMWKELKFHIICQDIWVDILWLVGCFARRVLLQHFHSTFEFFHAAHHAIELSAHLIGLTSRQATTALRLFVVRTVLERRECPMKCIEIFYLDFRWWWLQFDGCRSSDRCFGKAELCWRFPCRFTARRVLGWLKTTVKIARRGLRREFHFYTDEMNSFLPTTAGLESLPPTHSSAVMACCSAAVSG